MVRLMSRLLSGLRFRLMLLVAFASVLPAGLTLYTASEGRRTQAAGWKQRAREMDQLATREEEELIGVTRQLLIAVAESTQVRSGNSLRCQRLLKKFLEGCPSYSNLGVVKTNGEVLASAVPLPGTFKLEEHQFLRRTLQTRAFAIGDYPVGGPMGRATVNFGYPVLNRDQIQSVVFAALDLDRFIRLESELQGQLPGAATWTTIDYNGTILRRYPAPEEWIGKSFPEEALLKIVLNRPEGVVEALDSRGIPGFHVFSSTNSPLAARRVITILSIPRHALFADVDRALTRNLTWWGIAVGLGLAIGWFGSSLLVLRQVKALVTSASRLGSGDLRARTGLPHRRDELGQLARAFDQMAQALEQREMERQQAGEELRQYSHNLQILSQHLVAAQETERRRIARELHDSTAQWLAALAMNLAVLNGAAGELNPKASKLLADSLKILDQCSQEVRTLSYLLHPPSLDALGLAGAMEEYTDGFASRSGLQVKLDVPEDLPRLPREHELALFRFLQESLANVHRHSGSPTANIRLERDGHEVRLEVSDTGHGMKVTSSNGADEARPRRVGVGIAGMRERLRQLGGSLEIDSTAQGTTVRARVPYDGDET